MGRPHLIHPPFYSILIGLFWLLTKNLEFSGQIVSVIAGSLLVIPIYYLGRSMYGRKVGWLGAVLVAICPPLVYGSTETFSESLYTTLLIASVAFNWKALYSRNLLWVFLAGLTVGLSFLTHSMGVVFVPILLVSLFLWVFLVPEATTGFFFKKSAILILTFILVLLPYWIFLHQHTGRWLLSGTTHYTDISWYRLELHVGPEELRFRRAEAMISSQSESPPPGKGLVQFYLSHPNQLLERLSRNLRAITLEIDKTAKLLRVPPSVLLTILIVVVIYLGLGLFNMIKNRRVTRKELYLLLIFLSLSIFLLFRFEHRYFYPYVPLVVLGIAKATVEIEDLARGKHPNFARLLGFLLPGVLIVGMASSSAILIKKKQNLVPYEYKIMGQWMRENIKGIENKVVMSRKLGVPFYAGSKWNVLYYGDPSGLTNYAKLRGVDYLRIDDYTIPQLRPQLAFLLDPSKDHPGLEVVHVIQYRGRKIILYRLSRSY